MAYDGGLSVANFRKKFEDAVTKKRRRIYQAFESVLIEIVNWIKENHMTLGGWTDRTSNLNNSISYAGPFAGPASSIPKIGFGSSPGRGASTLRDAAPDEKAAVMSGVIYAGMSYAMYVEYRPGHWVLSGGMEEFRPKIMKLIAERAKI